MPDKKKPIRPTERRAGESPAAEQQSAAAPRMDSASQLAAFDAAMKLFHARNFPEARTAFARAQIGPERDVAQRAKLHIAMCDRRLSRPDVDLRTADDYYNYGIALMNLRNVASAREYLAGAARLAPDADHILYALGLAQALCGDLDAAYQSLGRAIELDPRNRAIARQDPDLAHLADRPPLDALLYPERSGW